jgi:hypothetical protein
MDRALWFLLAALRWCWRFDDPIYLFQLLLLNCAVAVDRPARQGIRVIAISRFGDPRTWMPAEAPAPAQADAHVCLLDALGIRRAGQIACAKFTGFETGGHAWVGHDDVVRAEIAKLVIQAATP